MSPSGIRNSPSGPYLDAAAERYRLREQVDTWTLARYVVAMVEGSIMLARTRQDRQLMRRHFEHLKQDLRQSFQG